VGDRWIVTQGLKPDDVVIVEGFQKVRPGAQVKPVPWKPKAASAPAQPAAGPEGNKP